HGGGRDPQVGFGRVPARLAGRDSARSRHAGDDRQEVAEIRHSPGGVMGNFIGGSAYAMSRDIAEGLILVNTNTFRKFSPVELKQLAFELDKVQKEARSEQPAGDDTQAIQKRGRKLGRITTALQIINQ